MRLYFEGDYLSRVTNIKGITVYDFKSIATFELLKHCKMAKYTKIKFWDCKDSDSPCCQCYRDPYIETWLLWEF